MRKKYRVVRGTDKIYWIQERVLFWWQDVLQINANDVMYRKEYQTLQEAYFATIQFMALDYIHKYGNIQSGSKTKAV